MAMTVMWSRFGALEAAGDFQLREITSLLDRQGQELLFYVFKNGEEELLLLTSPRHLLHGVADPVAEFCGRYPHAGFLCMGKVSAVGVQHMEQAAYDERSLRYPANASLPERYLQKVAGIFLTMRATA